MLARSVRIAAAAVLVVVLLFAIASQALAIHARYQVECVRGTHLGECYLVQWSDAEQAWTRSAVRVIRVDE